MKKRIRDRTWLAIVLCVCLLAVCLLGMILYLRPARLGFVPVEPPSDAFGMLLIDVLDEDAAESYHVDSFGVYVLAVQEQGPAERAGISSGDQLIHVNAAPVNSTAQFVEMQKSFLPAENVRLHFRRGVDAQNYVVTLVWNDE